MSVEQPANRLRIVDKVRAHQRQWLDETRQRVERGEPFAICNGDEVEEIFNVMDIPVLVINYWNLLITAQRKVEHFTKVLNDRGYAGKHFFGLGLASSIDPANAPWGGLPKPAIIVGSTRYESEIRITELWARECGCPIYPLDFNLSIALQRVPTRWWELVRDDWEKLVEPNRLIERMEQEKGFVRYLEQLTGRTFSLAKLMRSMELINEQMDYWRATQAIIAKTKPCPVTMRDQMSMYQAMWHRGTPTGVALTREYYEEVKGRAAKGIAGYKNERKRIYYNIQVPAWADFAEEKYGAVTVACSYTNIPDLYARNVHDNDPLKALAARHLFLFAQGPARILDIAKAHQCDAIISVEPHVTKYPSAEKQQSEAAGIPYLALTRDADDGEIRAKISEFFETRLA
jgi:hypothetical protein